MFITALLLRNKRRCDSMFKITRQEVDALRGRRLGRFITVINKSHGSRAKTYYVVEDQRVRRFLDKYRGEHVVDCHENNKENN